MPQRQVSGCLWNSAILECFATSWLGCSYRFQALQRKRTSKCRSCNQTSLPHSNSTCPFCSSATCQLYSATPSRKIIYIPSIPTAYCTIIYTLIYSIPYHTIPRTALHCPTLPYATLPNNALYRQASATNCNPSSLNVCKSWNLLQQRGPSPSPGPGAVRRRVARGATAERGAATPGGAAPLVAEVRGEEACRG